jgi:hypothetical protein
MFTIEANPTFPATITLVGQSRRQKLEVVFRHKLRDDAETLLTDFATDKKSAADAVLEVMESWDANKPLDAVSLAALQQNQPGALEAILAAWGAGLRVAREGN